jgi:hypothetical protein
MNRSIKGLALAVLLVAVGAPAARADRCATEPPPKGLVERCHSKVFWFPSGTPDRLRAVTLELALVDWMRTCVISDRAPGLVFGARDSVDHMFELIKDMPDLSPVRIIPDYTPLTYKQGGLTCYGVKSVNFHLAGTSAEVEPGEPVITPGAPSDVVKEAAAAGRKALQDPSVTGSAALSRFLSVLEQLEKYGTDFDDTWYNVQPWSTGDAMNAGACYKEVTANGNVCRPTDDALKVCERHLAQQVVEAWSYDKDTPARFAEVLDVIASDIQRSMDHLAAIQGQDSEGAVPCPSIKTFMSRIGDLAHQHSLYMAGGY